MAQSGDIGIDLGTSNVVIYMKGRGIVFREPSVVAIERESRQIIAFGTEAYRMIGRTPSNISIIRPLAQGEILDFDLTSSMLRYYITNVIGKRFFARPRAIMSVPSSVKELEKKALITSLFDAGLRRTQILDRVIAAALGAQLNFLGSYGSMVADMIETSMERGEIALSEEVSHVMDVFRRFMFQHIYHSDALARERKQAVFVLRELYGHYLENFAELPEEFIRREARWGRQQTVVDYVAGLTDSYAVQLFTSIFIPPAGQMV